MVASFTNALECIEQELHMLRQLLYRNHNQHEKTSVYMACKRVSKSLKLFPTKQTLLALTTLVEKTLRHNSKVGTADLNSICACVSDVFKVMNHACEAIALNLRASHHLKSQLKKAVFLPLFSVLVCLVARLAKALSIVALHFKR